MLRFRADHAAAQDSVFSEIGPEFAQKNGLIPVKTCCESREQYLTRPDLGRRFDPENSEIIRKSLPQGAKIQLVIGDGLSSAAILANAMDCARAIDQGLKTYGVDLGPILYVENARVGAGDFVGDLTGCQVVCILVGERPGLVTAESMSAYITYGPHTVFEKSTAPGQISSRSGNWFIQPTFLGQTWEISLFCFTFSFFSGTMQENTGEVATCWKNCRRWPAGTKSCAPRRSSRIFTQIRPGPPSC